MATGGTLGGLFGPSPIAPIQQHMSLAEESIQLLCQVLQACMDGDHDRAGEIYSQLDDNAAQVRAQRREIRQHMPRGLFLAMPRGDLLTLLELQEDLADTAQTVARPLTLRAMHIPPPLHRTLDRHGSLIAGCVAQCLSAIRELDELITDGFGARERRLIEKLLDGLDKQLVRVNAQHERLFRQLCKREGSVDTLDAIFFYRMADGLSRIADICSDIGEQLRLLIAH